MKLSAHGALLLATTAVLGLGACGGGGGDGSASPSGRPAVDRTATRSPDEAQESPPTDERTGRPTRTEAAAPTAQPPTTAQAQPPPTTAQAQPPGPTGGQAAPPAQTAVATTPPPTSDVAASAESTGAGDVWWLLLILMIGLLTGGLVIWQTRNRSDWDAEATTLVGATTAELNRLPAVLITATPGERALVWPPVRDDLGNLIGSWHDVASRTADETRRGWAIEVRTRLQDLIFAMDQENEVLAANREWRLLRPRVAAAEQALRTAMATRPMAETPVPSQPIEPVYVPTTAGYRHDPPEPPGQAHHGYPPSEPLMPPEPPDHARHRA
jgi:hypothetical protein